MGAVPHRPVVANKSEQQQLLRRWKIRADSESDGIQMMLSHEALHNCAVSGTTDKIFGPRWVAHAEIDRAWRSTSSVLLIVLFLLHAPVSQRFVYYFACQFIDNKR